MSFKKVAFGFISMFMIMMILNANDVYAQENEITNTAAPSAQAQASATPAVATPGETSDGVEVPGQISPQAPQQGVPQDSQQSIPQDSQQSTPQDSQQSIPASEQQSLPAAGAQTAEMFNMPAPVVAPEAPVYRQADDEEDDDDDSDEGNKKSSKKKNKNKNKKKPEYTKSELRLMSAIIFCEANLEPYAGKLAVGIVVMNRIESKAFPGDLKSVIYQSYQFSPVRNGSLKRALARYDAGKFKSANEKQCIKAAKAALTGEKDIVYKGKNKSLKGYKYFSCYLSHARFRIGGHLFK